MDYARGIDVSHYEDNDQTPFIPNFQKARALGISWVAIKVSQNNWADHRFDHFWKSAKDSGLLRMPYHFYDYSSGKVAVSEQAKYFCGLLEKDPPELMPAMDVEGYSPWGNLPPRDKLVSEIKQFMDVCDPIFGRATALYTNYATIKYSLSQVPQWLLTHPLWIAYPSAFLPTWTYYPWEKWTFWQNSWVGDGIAYGFESKSLDMDLYNGTVTDLMNIATVKPSPETLLTDSEKLKILWDEYKKTH